MSVTKIEKKKHSKFFLTVLMLIISLFVSLSPSYATNPDGDEDPDQQEEEQQEANDSIVSDSTYSFYNISSAAGAYFSDEASPTGDALSKSELWANTYSSAGGENVALASSLMGYVDDRKSEDKSWLKTLFTQGSMTLDIDGLKHAPNGETESSSNNSFVMYVQFGSAMSDLGLDKTTSSTIFIQKLFVGGLTVILYVLAYGVASVFKIVLDILWIFNPFRLMMPFFNGTYAPFRTNIESAPEALVNISNTISDVYKVAYELSWAIAIPILFGLLIFSLLVFRNSDKNNSKLKKYVIRILFIGLGLPLCGSLYTGALEKMRDSADDSELSSGINRIVMGTFFDFEKWVSNQNMNIPNDSGIVIAYDPDSNGASSLAKSRVRSTAYNLNALSYKFLDTSNVGSSVEFWNNSISEDSDGESQLDNMKDVYDMLSRYMSGALYTPNQFETNYKRQLVQSSRWSGEDGISADQIDEWFKEANDKGNYNDITAENPLFSVGEGGGLYGGGYSRSKFITAKDFEPNGSYKSGRLLTPLGTYNYLNSSFNSGSVTIYSAEKSVSIQVRQTHSAVNLVGRGVMSFLYFMNMAILLGAIAALGIFYSLGMMISNLKRLVKYIMNVPLALLGSVRSIGRVLSYTVIMILEILGNVFLFNIVQSILLSINGVVLTPLSDQLSSQLETTIMMPQFLSSVTVEPRLFATANVISPIFTLLIGSALTLAFAKKAIELRKSIISALDAVAEEFVSKLVGENSQVSGPEAKDNRLKRAAGAGAGLLAAGAAKKVADAYNSDGEGAEEGDSVEGESEGDESGKEVDEGGEFSDGDDEGRDVKKALDGSSEQKALPSSAEDMGRGVMNQKALSDGNDKSSSNGKDSDNPDGPSGPNSESDDSKSIKDIGADKSGEYGEDRDTSQSRSGSNKSISSQFGGNTNRAGITKDKNGNFVDKDGNLVDSDGNYIDQDGNVVSSDKAVKAADVDHKVESDGASDSNNKAVSKASSGNRTKAQRKADSNKSKAVAAAVALHALGEDEQANKILKDVQKDKKLAVADDKAVARGVRKNIDEARSKSLNAIFSPDEVNDIEKATDSKEAMERIDKALDANGLGRVEDVVDKFNQNAKANGLSEVNRDEAISRIGDNKAMAPGVLSAMSVANGYTQGNKPQGGKTNNSQTQTRNASNKSNVGGPRNLRAAARDGMKEAMPYAAMAAASELMGNGNSGFRDYASKYMGQAVNYGMVQDMMYNKSNGNTSANDDIIDNFVIKASNNSQRGNGHKIRSNRARGAQTLNPTNINGKSVDSVIDQISNYVDTLSKISPRSVNSALKGTSYTVRDYKHMLVTLGNKDGKANLKKDKGKINEMVDINLMIAEVLNNMDGESFAKLSRKERNQLRELQTRLTDKNMRKTRKNKRRTNNKSKKRYDEGGNFDTLDLSDVE